jgi:MFS family permease
MIAAARQRGAAARRTIAAVFANPDLRRLELGLIAATVSASGTAVVFALLAYRTGGSAAVAALIVATMWTSAIAAPIASIPADRFPRQRVIVCADATRIVVLLSTASFAVDGPPWLVIALACTVTVIGTASTSARMALVPALARDSELLLSVNALASTISSGAYLLGPAVVAVAVAVRGPGAALVALACASVASAVAAYGIRDPGDRTATTRARFLSTESIAGVRALFRARRVRVVVFLATVQTFVGGVIGVLLLVAAIETLGLGETGPSLLSMSLSLGTLLGSVVLLVIGNRRLGVIMGIGLALWGLSAAFVGLAPAAFVGLALVALIGLGDGLADVTALTIVQRGIPNDVLARALGALRTLFFVLTSLGSLLAPLVDELVGTRAGLLVAGLVIPVATFALWPLLAGAASPAPRSVALLHAVPFLSLLSPAALDRLASVAQPVSVSDGEVIVREGEDDRGFYVIAAGEVEVEVGGRVVASEGAGGYFGEVASLRDSPRTATVRASAPTELVFVPGAEFVDALSGDEAGYGAAEQVVAARLARAV